ncbi:hypothetical protein KV112_20690 [Mycolicibacter sp. MYC123]|uniref:Uncharacterized protein n=1 Tax=[Mycobacterium] zoologicum TaxID=2872311 RepID=A0ABU5YPX9_9MYCO|nr:hypothetical protein [Mycolicibacter sp. MYC123]MEB3052131.1 hypothetical protein [Mycolicibacter sp. MYC123]
MSHDIFDVDFTLSGDDCHITIAGGGDRNHPSAKWNDEAEEWDLVLVVDACEGREPYDAAMLAQGFTPIGDDRACRIDTDVPYAVADRICSAVCSAVDAASIDLGEEGTSEVIVRAGDYAVSIAEDEVEGGGILWTLSATSENDDDWEGGYEIASNGWVFGDTKAAEADIQRIIDMMSGR